METRKNVQMVFNESAKRYDHQRRSLIPCFDDFYSIAASLANSSKEAPKILDIGAGTGLLSSYMIRKYPNAYVTLIDLSEKMMEVSKERFKDCPNVTYIIDDYTNHEWTESFDIVVSSLSIHHLTDAEKQALYKQMYTVLNDNGVFMNADQVLGSSPYIETLYKEDWMVKVEQSGLSKEAICAAYERTKLDQMATLDDQLNWLRQAGFCDVDCVYKSFNFVVMFARKMEAL